MSTRVGTVHVYQQLDVIVTEMVNDTEWVKATNQEKRKDIAGRIIAERYDGWAVSGTLLDTLARAARES
ncbi:hypothetical protein BKD30_13560 [Tersicoccus phoenicis]|uniref:Uncharacterized protein n=1 Tax=Tersicoccus phoenicis TaxID=554083 RepID=A0A1R1L6S4_9MICC|nr:hypothetical protein BKD30_13560 [Tersicoccus phoenicis]